MHHQPPIQPKQKKKWRHIQVRIRLLWDRLRQDWEEYSENTIAVIGCCILLFFVLISLTYPLLRETIMDHAIYNPQVAFDPEAQPGLTIRHPLGLCCSGRDTLSVLMAATIPTFKVGLSAAITAALVGTTVGYVAAYFQGLIDLIFVQMAKAFLILPPPLVMVLVGSRFRDLEPIHLGSIYGLIAGLGGTALVIRAKTLKVLALPFIDASRAAGSGGPHILRKHVLPHTLPLIATYTTLAVRDAIIADGFLSFFGFTRSYLNWGYMIYDSGLFSPSNLPPLAMISLFTAAFYMISQGFRELVAPYRKTP